MWILIEREMNKKGMTTYELAKRAGFSNSSVLYALKNGANKNPRFKTMERIADALDVSMDVFRGGDTRDKE